MTPPVPRLATANMGPLLSLETRLIERSADIEAWFRQQWRQTPAPFYASTDLRNAGFKLAPVDTNLFPGGFNNLSASFEPLCILALQAALQGLCPEARQIVLVPENHTRNHFYLENVAQLHALLSKAGYRVRIGSLSPEITAPTQIELPVSGRSLTYEPLVRDGNRLRVGDTSPCAILLNNDLSAGLPEILKGLEQTVLPPAGWVGTRASSRGTSAFTARWRPRFLRCSSSIRGSSTRCFATAGRSIFSSVKAKNV